MPIDDMIRQYKIAEEDFKEKKMEIMVELNTIFEMIPFDIADPEDDDLCIDHFYIDEHGKARISWS